MIWFDNISSDSVKVIVERFPARTIPNRKTDVVSVPGRNGDIIFQQDAYENYEQEYEIYISAKKAGLNNIAPAVAAWLLKDGYRRLEDSYDPEIYRMAYYSGGAEIENYLNEFGRTTIRFNCMPQRWLKSGEYPVAMQKSGKLHNPTAFAAKPLIKVIGSGNGTVTVGDTEIALTDIDGFLLIDSELMHCYKDDQNCNNKMSVAFPKLGRETTVTWSGGINSVIITPRWYTI